MDKLECELERERTSHALVREELVTLHHQTREVDVHNHSLTLGLDAANLTIAKLENQVTSMKYRQQGSESGPVQTDDSSSHVKLTELRDEMSVRESEIKELRGGREGDAMTISILEDRLRDLTFTLHQTQSELKSTQTMGAVRREGWEREASDLKTKCVEMRREVGELTKKIDNLSVERNACKLQLTEVNMSLRKVIENIKRDATDGDGQMSSEEICDCLNGLITRGKGEQQASIAAAASTTAGKNLSNLRSCLSTLKSEMALLQSRLAPPAKTTSNSSHSSPEKTILS